MKVHVPKFIRDDFLRKLVAVFFAVLIWFAVRHQLREFEPFHDIPVTLRHEPDKIMLERRVVSATVMLRGARRRLQAIQSNDIAVTAQVPVVREGVYHYDVHLTADSVRTPPGTRVESIEPQSIRIQVDRIISKETPVRVRETGELGYGYKVVQRNIVPATVSLSGPSRIVGDVKDVVTEPVMLDETIRHSFEVDEVEVVPIPRLRINPSTVHVAYEIVHQSGEQTIGDIPIHVMMPRDNRLVLDSPLPVAAVTLRGPRTQLENVKPHMIRPFVDLTSITGPGRYTFRVNVWVNDSNLFAVQHVHPAEVELVLSPSDQPPADEPTPSPEPPEPTEDQAEPVDDND